jgi:proteic killer suppression protein
MIKTFRHKGLEEFYRTGSKRGIQPKHEKRLQLQLGVLDIAKHPHAMDVSGWRFHPLTGELKGHWSVWVNGNWRMTFTFDGEDAILVDYQDYH